MGAIANDWLPAVQAEFGKPYYRELYKFVTREYANGIVYPPAQDIFNALHLTPLSKVKAVILGQDPYHGDHQAHGLCFSVQPGTQIQLVSSLVLSMVPPPNVHHFSTCFNSLR